MILHGNADADIRKGDTITSPQLIEGAELRTFDFAVVNPPFSAKSWSNGLEQEYGRFEFGRPPEKNGDYAFLLHVLKSLKSTGKAAVIMPHGVLFRGHAEASIRRQLLDRGYIKGIIGLPANLFYGTGIPACIVVLDKENAAERTGVFMIDASKGFMKDGPRIGFAARTSTRSLTSSTNRPKSSATRAWCRSTEIASEANDYNLNIPRYIDSSEPEDIQDLHAHLHGGIPERDIDALEPLLGRLPEPSGTLFSSPTVPATATSRSNMATCSRLSSTRLNSRSSRPTWRTDRRVVRRTSASTGGHHREHEARRSDRHVWRRPSCPLQVDAAAR